MEIGNLRNDILLGEQIFVQSLANHSNIVLAINTMH